MSAADDPFGFADAAVLVGVWANSTRVHRSRDEFTVDFVRHVPELSLPALVARALVSMPSSPDDG